MWLVADFLWVLGTGKFSAAGGGGVSVIIPPIQRNTSPLCASLCSFHYPLQMTSTGVQMFCWLSIISVVLTGKSRSKYWDITVWFWSLRDCWQDIPDSLQVNTHFFPLSLINYSKKSFAEVTERHVQLPKGHVVFLGNSMTDEMYILIHLIQK